MSVLLTLALSAVYATQVRVHSAQHLSQNPVFVEDHGNHCFNTALQSH